MQAWNIHLKPSIKGCSSFHFLNLSSTWSLLNQISENPAVYTKLSCYLPWVADQYDMDYTAGVGDQDCLTGHGDITEVTDKDCRSNPSQSWQDTRDGIEAKCLFPFSLNGESHDTCLMSAVEDFTRPVFLCPIRTVKGAGPTGTDYTDTHLTGGPYLAGGYCPTNR